MQKEHPLVHTIGPKNDKLAQIGEYEEGDLLEKGSSVEEEEDVV
jgi:hypothetical protein